jgi:lipoic acid synthetase
VKPTRGRERPVSKEPTESPQPTPPPAAQHGTSVRLLGRLAEAGVTQGVDIGERKPDWMRAKARIGPDYLRLKKVMKDLDLVTVCEEAGCPNIFECWHDGTATFMIGGERCTRACGFCLVDTRKPEALDAGEPGRVAEAVERMGLQFAVVTAVARDDVPDGGAGHFAATIRAIRARTPGTGVEVLISDCKGDPDALGTIFDARPDVLNHNVETVPRLQRAARPSASYARSLAVLARAKAAGLVTKTSIIVGMGESFDEVVATMADLAAIGIDNVTVGQYLRPTTHHLPVARWWTPDEFDELKRIGEQELGLAHVEAGPLTRSSYHARQASDAAHGTTEATTATA